MPQSEKSPKKSGRQPPKSAWKPGQSGNPKGKPPGTRNRMTVLALAMMADDLEEITRKVVDAAKDGDMQAAKFVIERSIPPARERPISLDLPEIDTLDGISKAQALILQAVAGGELLPSEGDALAGIVEQRRKAIETQELEQRIAALEAKK